MIAHTARSGASTRRVLLNRCRLVGKTAGMHVDYEGGVRGLRALEEELRAEGLEVSYEAPMEERGVGEVAATVAVHIAVVIADKSLGDAAAEAARRAIAQVREKLPGLKAEVLVEDD